MKCALDLQATAVKRAEEIRQAELEKARREQARVEKNTIQFCEKLGNQLEQKADEGKAPKIEFYMEYRGKDKLRGRQMFSTRSDYADRRLSFNPAGEELDLRVMAKWFKPYCFQVCFTEEPAWQYGWGECRIYCVSIKPAPECLG